MKPRSKPEANRRKVKAPRRAVQPTSVDGAIKGPLPAFVAPCLATLVAAPPPGDDWVHEIKFDGYRIEARIDNGHVRLLTRNGLDWTERFGTLPALLSNLPCQTALIDGEVIAEDEAGRSSFTALMDALKAGRSGAFIYYCFDLLYLDGLNLEEAALADRKELLLRLLGPRWRKTQLRFSEHLSGNGRTMLKDACRLGLEGLVSKRLDKPYRSGRHDDWLKSKCIQVDEFVIIGYLVSNVSANAVGALVVGYFDKKRLVYAGRVGTGFTQRNSVELMRRLKPLATPSPAVVSKLTGLQRRGVVWVEPVLVAQIEYRAWTADNLLRHAAFKGLREDKPAAEVRRPVVKTPKS